MHIPDGYLSPSTCLTFGAAMLPVWGVAARKVKARLRSRHVPLMGMAAAFSFVVMMYNIPMPGGTTAHTVGGGLLAVVLGPWAASVCITVALAIQALLFGDGGIWTFGANCFNMAFVLPFTAYGAYRLVAGKSDPGAARRWVGAAVGGYAGLNAAALATALELGLQPLLFHTANGTPLYCPYPLSAAVPAMMLGHLTLAGGMEGVVTALVVRYLQSTSPALLALPDVTAAAARPVAGYRRLWWGLGALVVLSPLGLLARGTAWGEWSTDEVRELLGSVPAGLARLSGSWSHVLFPDYGLPAVANGSWSSAFVYMLCAVIGVALVGLLMHLLGRVQAAEQEGRGG
jgi:cobalt/nickel transport system permease protein